MYNLHTQKTSNLPAEDKSDQLLLQFCLFSMAVGFALYTYSFYKVSGYRRVWKGLQVPVSVNETDAPV